jgi:glycosyltransferase involved in cell wall biosynthesis
MIGDVAAIICTRNGHSRGFLDEALNSVFKQTVRPAEVIVVDDGSTDGTAAEVRRACPGVNVVSNCGSGLGAARNTGIKAARSTWIAFLDDDDVWLPTKIADQLAQVETCTHPERIIWGSKAAYIEKGGVPPIPEQNVPCLAVWPACLLRCSCRTSGAMFSQELFRKIGPFNESIAVGSAYDFWIRCFEVGIAMCMSANILLYHRRGHPQMTSVSRAVSLQVEGDTLLLPYLERIPPRVASRIRAARQLTNLRGIAFHCGLSSAIEYWSKSPLRPVSYVFRSDAFIIADSAAAMSPLALGQRLRALAVRLLNV